MLENDFWIDLDKKYVISMLKDRGLDDHNSNSALEVFVKILEEVESAESNHIRNHIVSGNDIRSAALCFEAMGAFNLLKKTIGENNE